MNHSIPELSLRSIWALSRLMLPSLFMVSSAVFATVLDAGGEQICGLQPDDTVECWGNITNLVPRGEAFSQISAGGLHSCGILKNKNTIKCWLPNYFDNGQGTPPKDTFSQVSAGYFHTCGVTTDNTIKCWGKNRANDYGQTTPPDGHFSQVSAGRWHSCGIRTDNTVACWGSNTNPYAKKDGSERQATPPSGTFLQVSAAMGGWHTCGVRTDNTVACWGSNNHGQATPPSGTFSEVSTGKWHSCGLRTDNTIACWGSDSDGQATPPSSSFYSVTAGTFTTCGVRINNTVACWGANSDGRRIKANDFLVKSSVPTSACFLYGVQDYPNRHNTLFLTIDADTFEVNAFGKPYGQLYLQAMDFHPLTNQLYAISSKGILYKFSDSSKNEIGEIGFKRVEGLTFHPEGILWGWESGTGLFQINNKKDEPNPKRVKVVLPYSGEVEIEDITWDNGGTIIYGVENLYEKPDPDNTDETSSDDFKGVRLYAYDNGSKSVSVVCNQLMGSLKTEVSALDTLPDNRLLFGFRKKAGLSFSVINVERCEMMTEIETPSDYNEIKSIAWPHNCDLP
jgi:hypothetical protein